MIAKIFKSKTMMFSMMLTIFSIIQSNVDLLQQYLGTYGGLFTVGVAVIVAVLRMVTTQPLSEK